MALSVYPHDNQNLSSKSPPPQIMQDTKSRQRGNSAAARPSLRLHIANPTERLPVADTQTKALYNVPADPTNLPLPAELRHRGASFNSTEPSPQIRITTTNLHSLSGNSTPSSSSGGSAASARGTTATGSRFHPSQMSSAGTVTTATTDDLSAFSISSNISTPATVDSAHPFGPGPGTNTKNRSRPLPLPPPTSRPPSRGNSTPEHRLCKSNAPATTSAPITGGQPQQLMFDPATSTWIIKPSMMSSPLRSAPPSKLGAHATYPQALSAQPSGYPHGQHHPNSNSISRTSHSQSHHGHGHTRSRSDQTREVAPLPKPVSTGSDSSAVDRWKGRQPVRTAPNSDDEIEPQESFGGKWKGKQPVREVELVADADGSGESEKEREIDPDKLPGGKKWKGKEPIRGEGWHLMFPNASKNSSGISVHSPPVDNAATPPLPLPATASVPGAAIIGGAAGSSSSSLDLPPSLSKNSTIATATLNPEHGRPQSISSTSISSRESRDESAATSKWKGKGKEVIRRSGSISSISSYNSISGAGAGITKKSSKKGKGKGKGKHVAAPNLSPNPNPNSSHIHSLNVPLTAPYIPGGVGVNTSHGHSSAPPSASVAPMTTPTPNTAVPLPLPSAPISRPLQHLPSPPTTAAPERTFTPSRNLPVELTVTSVTPPLPLPPSLQIGGGRQQKQHAPPVPPKDAHNRIHDNLQARAMANDPFSSAASAVSNVSANANMNPQLLYVYREYRDTDSDSLSSSQRDTNNPVDIGYGYGEVGFEDDERERERSPSPMRFSRRKRNSLDFLDDDEDLEKYDDIEDDELSPGGEGYDMQQHMAMETQTQTQTQFGFGHNVPVAAPVPRRPGISVSAMEQAEMPRLGADWREQLQVQEQHQPTSTMAVPASVRVNGTGVGRSTPMDALSPARVRDRVRANTPGTPSGGLSLDFDPGAVLGPEDEMVFSKNPSPTRYGGGYRSPFTFGGDEPVFVRGKWRLRSPSPTNSSPLDLGLNETSQRGPGMLSPDGGRGSEPLSPITFNTSTPGHSLSPLSGPNSPIRRQKTGATMLGANLSANARKLRRYASEESLLIDNPSNSAATYNNASYNNFNNRNYDSNYYNNYNHSAMPMRLAPNRYVEPETEMKPKKSVSGDSVRRADNEVMSSSSRALDVVSSLRRDRDWIAGGNDSGSGRKRGASVPKVANSGHGQVLTKQHRAPMDREVGYDFWIEKELEAKGKRV